MKRFVNLLAVCATLALVTAPAFAQSNPCNPCGGGKASAGNPCNPCGGDVSMKAHMPAVNPCHAKMGTVYYVNDPMGRNQVSFTSEAPLEDINGLTNEIRGYVVFNAQNEKMPFAASFNVATGALTTGIPLRDEHLHSAQWLNAGANPQISFTVEKVKDFTVVKDGKDSKTFEATVEGPFTLNGKTKKMKFPARITWLKASEKTKARLPGDLLAVRADFDVKLKDFGVKGFDGVVGNKVGESIGVSVRFVATNAGGMDAMNPCNPCGGKKKSASNPCNPCGGNKGE